MPDTARASRRSRTIPDKVTAVAYAGSPRGAALPAQGLTWIARVD